MAGDALAAQLAILEEALQRLEGELARDPAWAALQAGTDLDDIARAQLTATLDANPVYRAWRNMHDATTLLVAQGAEADRVPPRPVPTTLAEALQHLPPDEGEPEPAPETAPSPDDVAQVLAAEVATQTAHREPPTSPAPPAAAFTAEEREAYDVGERATQAVERILAIPVIAPIAPRTSALASAPPSAPVAAPEPEHAAPIATTPPAAPEQSAPATPGAVPPAATVPADAEDLAFLLRPATRPAAGDESPFLKRLVAEAQSQPTRAAVLPPADPFMVPPADTPPAPSSAVDATPPEPAPAAPKDEDRRPRLARLLKAWSRH